jgi:hypothetical protein
MIVDILESGGKRISAKVTWENSARVPQTIYFESATELSRSSEAFLLSCVYPAMRAGEKRLKINNGGVCPSLLQGLTEAMAWFCNWSGGKRAPVELEVATETPDSSSVKNGLSVCFLSGGVDSLFTLYKNHSIFESGNKNFIRAGIFVGGFDIDPGLDKQYYEKAIGQLRPVAEDRAIELILVVTNIRELDMTTDTWTRAMHGAALAATAYAVGAEVAFIGSGKDIAHIAPWGSHPVIDPLYGDSLLQIYHDGTRFSRLQKVKLLSQYPVALRNIRVCHSDKGSDYNCCKCNKCIRTMLELIACNAIDGCATFKNKVVTPDMLPKKLGSAYQRACYEELLIPLADKPDIIKGIHRAISAWLWSHRVQLLKGRIKDFDPKILNGSMLKLKNLIVK